MHGYSEPALKAKGERLRYLIKLVDLDDPEEAKEYIASQTSWSKPCKQGVAYVYSNYVETNGLHACTFTVKLALLRSRETLNDVERARTALRAYSLIARSSSKPASGLIDWRAHSYHNNGSTVKLILLYRDKTPFSGGSSHSVDSHVRARATGVTPFLSARLIETISRSQLTL